MKLAVAAPAVAPTPAVATPPSAAPSAEPTWGWGKKAPFELDGSLVDGIKLPRIPNLPGMYSKGMKLAELMEPPAPDSVAGKVDLAFVKGAQRLHTAQGDAWARRMDTDGGRKVWMELAKRYRALDGVGRAEGWAGTALLTSTILAAAGVTQLAKARYDRLRPFQVDSSITPVVRLPKDASYPSGHTSAAFAAARILSVLAPSLAKEAYSLATQVGVSRVYGGVHFPSDVVVGAALGTGVAEAALRTAGRLVPQGDAAAVEAAMGALQLA